MQGCGYGGRGGHNDGRPKNVLIYQGMSRMADALLRSEMFRYMRLGKGDGKFVYDMGSDFDSLKGRKGAGHYAQHCDLRRKQNSIQKRQRGEI